MVAAIAFLASVKAVYGRASVQPLACHARGQLPIFFELLGADQPLRSRLVSDTVVDRVR